MALNHAIFEISLVYFHRLRNDFYIFNLRRRKAGSQEKEACMVWAKYGIGIYISLKDILCY